jgi:hypothetical protein
MANVWIVQKCDQSCFLLELFAVLFLDCLDRHDTAKAGVPRLPHFSTPPAPMGAGFRKGRVWCRVRASFLKQRCPIVQDCSTRGFTVLVTAAAARSPPRKSSDRVAHLWPPMLQLPCFNLNQWRNLPPSIQRQRGDSTAPESLVRGFAYRFLGDGLARLQSAASLP